MPLLEKAVRVKAFCSAFPVEYTPFLLPFGAVCILVLEDA